MLVLPPFLKNKKSYQFGCHIFYFLVLFIWAWSLILGLRLIFGWYETGIETGIKLVQDWYYLNQIWGCLFGVCFHRVHPGLPWKHSRLEEMKNMRITITSIEEYINTKNVFSLCMYCKIVTKLMMNVNSNLYSAWHLKATPNVELKYSSHTTCNPKNSAYLCSTSHAKQSYATRLSKSFFLAEILLVKIDDFCPNLAGAAHIWPQGFIGSLRVRAK